MEEIFLVYCIHCGQENPDDAVSCSNCDKQLYPPRVRGKARYRPRPTRRSSNACWEDDKRDKTSRGDIIRIGFIFILVALFISWAIYDTASFAAFWEGFGRTIGQFFTSDYIKIIGPAIFVIGLIVILYGLTRSRD